MSNIQQFHNEAYLVEHKALVVFSSAKSKLVGKASDIVGAGIPVRQALDANVPQDSEHQYVLWGPSNSFPTDLVEAIRSNISYRRGLAIKADQMYALGLEYGVEVADKNGKRKFQPSFLPEIENFLYYSNNLSGGDLYHAQCRDVAYFGMLFPEYQLAADRSKILAMLHHKTAQCRLGVMNQYSVIEQCYIAADWKRVSDLNKDALRRPVISMSYDPVLELRLRTDAFQYVVPVGLPSELENYYTNPDHLAIIESNWLDVANHVPRFQTAMMKNKTTINYVVSVADWYWPAVYPEWDKWELDASTGKEDASVKIRNARQAELERFNQFFGGLDAAGRTMMIEKTLKPSGNGFQEFQAWTITPLESPKMDGSHREDARDAHTMILFALGVDESLFGARVGTERQGGSDKREAFNIGSLTVTPMTNLILRTYNFVSRYNNWTDAGQPIKFRVRVPEMQTLDKVSPEKRDTTAPK